MWPNPHGLSHGLLPITFPNTFLLLLPNIEQKGIPLYDKIVWYKIPESSKICQTVVIFFH